jgi:hypothetical protein
VVHLIPFPQRSLPPVAIPQSGSYPSPGKTGLVLLEQIHLSTTGRKYYDVLLLSIVVPSAKIFSLR